MPRRWAWHQAVEVVERAEDRVDLVVVGHVVADVEAGRRVDRREPDRVDAERSLGAVVEIVQVLDDAGQVAHSIVVRIGERARIDLVHDSALPPVGTERGTLHRGPERAPGDSCSWIAESARASDILGTVLVMGLRADRCPRRTAQPTTSCGSVASRLRLRHAAGAGIGGRGTGLRGAMSILIGDDQRSPVGGRPGLAGAHG